MDMSNKNGGNSKRQNSNVIQLGFNISVSGDSDTDFQIVLDDDGKENKQWSQNEIQLFSAPVAPEVQPQLSHSSNEERNMENNQDEVRSDDSKRSTSKNNEPKLIEPEHTSFGGCSDKTNSITSNELRLIDDLKNTMDHFEKFSSHLKEIPRFKSSPIATSTPFPEKQNSRSESSLMHIESRPRRFSHLYNYNSRKEYFKGSTKPLPTDLFLRPLPGENLYKKGILGRYHDNEPCKFYGSVDNLIKPIDLKSSASWKSNDDKFIIESGSTESPLGILKKYDRESGDKQSSSSADSIKDIKIYQNGGILIMQNFKDNHGIAEKREISDFSAKLIENCNKLKEEINNSFLNVNEKISMDNAIEENKTLKMVQFDLFEVENGKENTNYDTHSKDDSPKKIDSVESTIDCLKTKEGTPQSQDFPSMSTQENDSIVTNPPGMSPGASGKKLEWDSGADVGYINMDLSKENLSTIERFVLKGLSSDGFDEKDVIFEKKSEGSNNCCKILFQKQPSDDDIQGLDLKQKLAQVVKEKKNKHKEVKSYGKIGETEQQQNVNIKNVSCIVSGDSKSKKQPVPLENAFTKEVSCNEENPIRSAAPVGSVDKSVNVDTLFNDKNVGTIIGLTGKNEDCRQSNSPSKSRPSRPCSKVKKLKKKNSKTNITAPLKDKIESIIDIARLSSKSIGRHSNMAVSKKLYKKVNMELHDLELSRDLDEILVDHRYKQSFHGRECAKESVCQDVCKTEKENNTKRPISGSSSSNNTVLSHMERKNEGIGKKGNVKLIDRIIQAGNLQVESVGIQAILSQKSSSSRGTSSGKVETKIPNSFKDAINMSSKNIQAFGLNSSLPKQLEHSKKTRSREDQNTKGTQYFGGPINSLPNYHSKLVTKKGESCGRMLKVLKSKETRETEIIRLSEENQKNILANDTSKCTECKKSSGDSMKNNASENKENFIEENTNNLKGNDIGMSHKLCKSAEVEGSLEFNKSMLENNFLEAKERENGTKEELLRMDSLPSDVYSHKFLTSEALKKHGDSIDRNIIQEKYFRSQLAEIERRKMISKSTSMEMLPEQEQCSLVADKKGVTVGCQYSLQSKDELSDGKSEKQEMSFSTGKLNLESPEKEVSDQYDSSQNLADEEHLETSKGTNVEVDFGTGDSFPSSTQTADSWIPGHSAHNSKNVVGRARSFEYLPGHIYESSGNLREKLPSEYEHNVITGSSSGSSEAHVTNRSLNEGQRNSEGRNTLKLENSAEENISDGRKTLVLENSNEISNESDQLKSLDENLTHLNVIVTKLREKDALIQSITQSLLINFRKRNGSGDSTCALDLPKSKIINEECFRNEENRVSSPKGDTFNKKRKDKEISVGCQTEPKSCNSSLDKYMEKRKDLESRVAADKETQIKWIEKEIYHLNILRGLLEKQNKGSSRKKKHPHLTISQNSSKSEKSSENILSEVHSRPITPVYGCTISLLDNKALEENPSASREESVSSVREDSERVPEVSDNTKYGMTVSLNGSLRKVILLPAGVQVSLKDTNIVEECFEKEVPTHKKNHDQPCQTSAKSEEIYDVIESERQNKKTQSNALTQFPSAKRTHTAFPSTSVQTDIPSPENNCCYCQQKHCVCLALTQSEKSGSSMSRWSRDNRKISDGRSSPRLDFESGQPVKESNGLKITSNSTIADIIDMNCFPEKRQKGSSKAGGSTSNSAETSFGSKNGSECKCQNCPKRVFANTCRSEKGRRDSCRANVYVTSDKSSDGPPSCQCSRAKIKSSACACHVTKIHRSHCCSPEKRSCSCSKKKFTKKTETQSCQTDEIVIEEKHLVTNAELVKPARGPEVVYPCEGKVTVQAKDAVEKKLSYSPKISFEKRQPYNAKMEMIEKSALLRETPEADVAVEEKTPVPECKCNCKKKREKQEEDDHPRHYFLKIEETEMDDSIDSIERRKSLEVITVTVPIKRAGKARIYGSNFRQTSVKNRTDKTDLANCSCWEDHLEDFCRKYIRNHHDNSLQSHHSKMAAEKEDPSKRFRKNYLKHIECDSFEDITRNDPSIAVLQSSSSQEGYRESSVEPTRSEAYFTKISGSENSRLNRYSKKLGENSSRDTQSDYDSHKECRHQSPCPAAKIKGREIDHNKSKDFADDKKRHGAEKFDGHSVPGRKHKQDRDVDDYYNYNKREHMTKSELIKEEEKKKRSHQPTLQEYLESNRPDFCSSAENRRRIIFERAKDRAKKHDSRMECLINLIHQCDRNDKSRNMPEPKRIFTTSEMREQTLKRYKKLPEVTGKIADQKKKEEYRTNKLMADIFAKKLQIETLKGHINLSNSVSVLSTF